MIEIEIKNTITGDWLESKHYTDNEQIAIDRAIKKHFGRDKFFVPDDVPGYGRVGYSYNGGTNLDECIRIDII